MQGLSIPFFFSREREGEEGKHQPCPFPHAEEGRTKKLYMCDDNNGGIAIVAGYCTGAARG